MTHPESRAAPQSLREFRERLRLGARRLRSGLERNGGPTSEEFKTGNPEKAHNKDRIVTISEDLRKSCFFIKIHLP